jgi:hypothetical protein
MKLQKLKDRVLAILSRMVGNSENRSNTEIPETRPRDLPLHRLGVLAWLADAPLFIDKERVAGFYDAVVRPEGRQGTTVISLERYEGQMTKLDGALEGEVSVSELITTLLPFLDVKGKGSAGAGHEWTGSETRGRTVELHPIETPQRQLVQLALHYLTNLPKRMKVVSEPWQAGWYDDKFIKAVPRALVFLDFPPHTKFIPMAAEVDKGRVVTIYDKLKSGTERVPEFPDFSDKDYAVKEEEYWNWFDTTFNPKVAMETVEKVIAEGGRIQWIAYRVPLNDQNSLHVDISGRGEFDTGTFAYNLIKRGFSHGLRIVGTLKSEPDLDVLAIFEK